MLELEDHHARVGRRGEHPDATRLQAPPRVENGGTSRVESRSVCNSLDEDKTQPPLVEARKSNKRVDGVVRAPAGPATRRSHTSLMDLACALLLLLLLLLLCTCADAMTPLFGVHAVR